MHDDMKVIREAAAKAREVEGSCLLLDGCFPATSIERAMRLRALHQQAREVAQEIEALAQERQKELDAEERMGRCRECEDAPAQWGEFCAQCLRDAETGWTPPRRDHAHRASMERPTPAPEHLPFVVVQ